MSVDGVRQDFIVANRPAGAGDLRVELGIAGASAAPAADGVRLVLADSGRELAYNRLHVTDASGRELAATWHVLSADRLAIHVVDTAAAYPVRIDPTFSNAQWSALGTGMTGGLQDVQALAVSGTDLYAGGYFTTAGGVTVNSIAKWNGSTWSALGSGVTGGSNPVIHAIAFSGNDLYAGGIFTTAGGVTVNNIAKWNGSAWSALGSGTSGVVFALGVSGTDLYAGGGFVTAGGVTVNNIAKWNGSTWSALGSGLAATYAIAI